MPSRTKRDRSRRGELQRLLGEQGEILPRISIATVQMPAQGWYARMADGELTFLGDNTRLANQYIERLLETQAGIKA